MAVVDELVTLLGVELSPEAEANLGKFKQGIDGITSGLKALGVAVTAGLVATGVFINQVTEEASALDKLSKQTGVSTDALQELQYAASQVGAEASAVTNDILALQKSMSSPIPGEFNMTLAMFGVSARGANGELKTTDQLLTDMADRFASMDAQTASQWASKIGVSDDTLLLLREGKDGLEALRQEAHALGGIIPSEAIKIASQFKKDVEELKFALKGIASTVAIATIPAMSKLVEGFKEFLLVNKEWIQLGLGAIIEGFVNGFDRFLDVVVSIAEKFKPLLSGITSFLPEMEAVEVITHLVTGALTGLLVLLSPIIAKFALIGGAVLALSVLFEDFFTYLEGGDSVIGTLFEGFAEKYPGVIALAQSLGDIFKKVFIDNFGEIKAYVETVITGFVELFDYFLTHISNVFGQLSTYIDSFSDKFPALSNALSVLASAIKDGVLFAFDMLVDSLKGLMEILSEMLGFVGDAIDSIMGGAEWLASSLGFGDDEEESQEEDSRVQLQRSMNSQNTYIPYQAQMAVSHSSNSNNKRSEDNRQFTVNITSPDPLMSGQQVENYYRQNGVNVNTPGQYAPRSF